MSNIARINPRYVFLAMALWPAWKTNAQPLVLDPSPSTPIRQKPAEAPKPAPTDAGKATQGASTAQGGEEAAPENIYYGDYLDDSSALYEDEIAPSTIPSTHDIEAGDTLWDISELYFGDPFTWPKVWGMNPQITDAHWIYPGNKVRLREDAVIDPSTSEAKGTTEQSQALSQSLSQGQLRHPVPPPPPVRPLAYVETNQLRHAGKVAGSTDAKLLLASGDSIYIDYGKGQSPKEGLQLAVYSNPKPIMRGKTQIGAYVEIAGEVVVSFSQEGKRARATITRSVNAIERDMLVGPVSFPETETAVVPNSRNLSGEIVEILGPDVLIAARAMVIVDKGKKDGVQAGNRFLVVRSGDAYKRVMSPGGNVGQQAADFPTRAIGEILVVQASESTCLGTVRFSVQEFEPGDHVIMIQGK